MQLKKLTINFRGKEGQYFIKGLFADAVNEKVLVFTRLDGVRERHRLRDIVSFRVDPAAQFDLLEHWESERPIAFLEHATEAPSQYDAQYRSMAAEILALRKARYELARGLRCALGLRQK